MAHLETVLKRLRDADLKIKPSKCSFRKKIRCLLGHQISEHGIQMNETKIFAVKNFSRPHKLKTIRAWLGLTNYFRHFLHDCATTAKPLNRLTTKNWPFLWRAECECAFEELKRCLIIPPSLCHFDPYRPVEIDITSGVGMGGILIQLNGENEQVVAYASKALN